MIPTAVARTPVTGPSSTATQRTTPERLPQDALPPWRHPNFPLIPTTTPVQTAYEAHVINNAVGAADYVRRLLLEYILTGSTRQLPPGVEVQPTNPPQDKQKTEQRQFGHINPELLQVPDPDPIEYVEWPEFRKEWEASLVQFAPIITALPPPLQEEVGSDAVTRGQKRKEEEEGIVGKGSGKNNDFNFTEYLHDSDMEADREQLDEDGSEEEEIRRKDKRKVDEGQKQGGKEDEGQGKGKEQEEDTDVDDEYNPHNDDDTINEPNFIWNENRYTSWGKCYFKALEDDKFFGNGKTIRKPFHRNEDQFILKRHPSDGQIRVYIPDGRCKIGSEFYPMRRGTLLIHSAHHRLAHNCVSKTYRDILKDTIWPGHREDTKRFVEGCHTWQIIKQPTQRPASNAQMMQVPKRPWRSISIDVLGPVPRCKGFEHALVVVDRFSSLVSLVPMKKKYTTQDIADALISKVYCYHGIPQEMIANRGPQFVSNFFRELQEAFDIHLIPSTAFHQQSNGSAECTIKTIRQTL